MEHYQYMGKFESFNHAKDGYEHHDNIAKTKIYERTHLGAPDGAVDGDLLVPPDTERSDRVAGFGEHWGLPSQLLKHL